MLNFLFSSPADSLALRALLAFLTALVIGLACGPALIRELKKLHFGQAVRTDGPKTHLAKDGTPTMGGALILAAITLSTLCWADLGNRFIWVVLFVTLGYGAIGWIDDYRKIVHHDPHGMSAREKFSWQSVIGLAAAFYLALALAVEPGGTFAEAIGAWYDARFPLDVTANIHLYLPLWTDWAFPLVGHDGGCRACGAYPRRYGRYFRGGDAFRHDSDDLFPFFSRQASFPDGAHSSSL